ncbi:MAG: GGDEF domain-containing protein, partial [Bacillota bacterium]
RGRHKDINWEDVALHFVIFQGATLDFQGSADPGGVLAVKVEFKTYNDTFGHVAGDVVLQKTAEIIRNSIRLVDIAGRYGGEEFVIILPGTKEEGAVAVAERIWKSVETYPFPHRRVTVSLGVASAKRNDSVDSLFARADQACYQAKRQGKNRFCLDPS